MRRAIDGRQIARLVASYRHDLRGIDDAAYYPLMDEFVADAKNHCFQLQRYFRQMFMFHLNGAGKFASLEEAHSFLDLPGQTCVEQWLHGPRCKRYLDDALEAFAGDVDAADQLVEAVALWEQRVR